MYRYERGNLRVAMARDPKGKNKKRLLSPPRDGGENEVENVQKTTDFFDKFQSLITRFKAE